MHQLIFMMAAAQPEKKIIADLATALREYVENPTELGKQKIEMEATLLLTKFQIDKHGLEASMDSFDKTKKAKEMLTPAKN